MGHAVKHTLLREEVACSNMQIGCNMPEQTAGLAAAELGEAAGRASECAKRCGNLGAAWKLVGDTHLAMAWTGAPLHAGMGGGARRADRGKEGGKAVWAADASAPSAKPLVAALLAGWRARIGAVLRARRAYAAALHLAPGAAGAWGDLALAYFAEAQLRRAHRHFAPQQALALRLKAERLLRGETMHCKHPDWSTGLCASLNSSASCCGLR